VPLDKLRYCKFIKFQIKKKETKVNNFRVSDDPLLFVAAQYGDTDYDVIRFVY